MPRYILLILAALLLSCLGFFNGFPIVFSDTGAYIASGFQNTVPPDRPIYYGLFIRHLSLADSLFLVNLIQGLILAYLIYKFLRLMIGGVQVKTYYLLVTGLLVTLTGVSFFVSFMTPDLFTSFVFLSSILLLWGKELSRVDRILLTSILVFSLMVHMSHVMIFAGFLTVASLIKLVQHKFQWKPLKPFRKLWLSLIAAIILIPSLHYAIGRKFQYTEASHVFMMSHLIEIGILKPYLKESCEEKNYNICPYVDELRLDNFMWGYGTSPLYKTGGWAANKEEYDAIISDILTTPKYLNQYFQRTVEYTFVQLFTFKLSTPPIDYNGAPSTSIKQYYPHLMAKYGWSRQSFGNLDLGWLDTVQWFSVMLALAWMLFRWSSRNTLGFAQARTLIGYTLLYLVLNAAVCSTFSGVVPRYQARIIWLVPLVAMGLMLTSTRIRHWIDPQQQNEEVAP